MKFEDAVARLLTALEVSADEQALVSLLELAHRWNQRHNLTGARTPDALADVYLADSVVLSRHVEPGQRWVDVGAGGGAPGLPLGVLAPNLEVVLVEPRVKRVAFLRTSIGSLNLEHVSVQRCRSDALPATSFDVAVSRATLPPPEWLAEGARLATRAVWVLLAQLDAPTLDGWHADLDIDYEWPLTHVRRRAIRYCRSVASGGAPAM